jgi:hypothetical protein
LTSEYETSHLIYLLNKANRWEQTWKQLNTTLPTQSDLCPALVCVLHNIMLFLKQF